FDVQQAFEDPRGQRVGPAVDRQLDAAGQAVEEELKRRGGRAPSLPGTEGVNPFRPGDAHDAPRQGVIGGASESDSIESDASQGGVEEAFPDPEGTQTEGDEIDPYAQQGAGGYQFRPLNQPELTPEQREAQRRQLEKEQAESAKNCETI